MPMFYSPENMYIGDNQFTTTMTQLQAHATLQQPFNTPSELFADFVYFAEITVLCHFDFRWLVLMLITDCIFLEVHALVLMNV